MPNAKMVSLVKRFYWGVRRISLWFRTPDMVPYGISMVSQYHATFVFLYIDCFTTRHYIKNHVAVPEWLMGMTRNHMASAASVQIRPTT